MYLNIEYIGGMNIINRIVNVICSLKESDVTVYKEFI